MTAMTVIASEEDVVVAQRRRRLKRRLLQTKTELVRWRIRPAVTRDDMAARRSVLVNRKRTVPGLLDRDRDPFHEEGAGVDRGKGRQG
jgi:hypothetical protein